MEAIMKLFDSLPHGKTGVDIGAFDGGMRELRHDEITKSFIKAKKMVLKRLEKELNEIKERINFVESLNECDCPEIANPYC